MVPGWKVSGEPRALMKASCTGWVVGFVRTIEPK
jgi:hypothetical protein